MIHAYVSGPPGSGKTTLCKKVCAALKLEHLSTGEILREHIKQRTELGKIAKKCIASKSLVPDDVVIEMLVERMAKANERGWILDGFPRTTEQAVALRKKNITPTVVLILELPTSEIRGRLVGRRFDNKTGDIYHIEFNMPRDPEVAVRLIHRDDDTAEKVPPRIEAYSSYNQPMHREFLSVAYDIDADRPIPDVITEAIEILRSSKKGPSNQVKEMVKKSLVIEPQPEETEFSPPKSRLVSSIKIEKAPQKIENEIQRLTTDLQDNNIAPKRAPSMEVTKLVDMERFKTMLVSGFDVIKHGRRGAPHTRTLFCDVEFKRLFWQKPDKKELKAKLDQSIALADVIQVVQGMKTDVFKRSGDSSKSDRYLSLIGDDRTLDIEVASEELCMLLVNGLTALAS
ncbi:hypothetical protein AeNC1_002716 [Aphanomyces euteiches]|nr:hypothetical protein AeNC1_002716 [Aphanomyces euteiches]